MHGRPPVTQPNMWPGSNFQRNPYFPYGNWTGYRPPYRPNFYPLPGTTMYPSMTPELPSNPYPTPEQPTPPSDIPLPDGPPPDKPSAPSAPSSAPKEGILPTPNFANAGPVRFNAPTTGGPFRFNLNQNKFTPFNVAGKKKKKKNKKNNAWNAGGGAPGANAPQVRPMAPSYAAPSAVSSPAKVDNAPSTTTSTSTTGNVMENWPPSLNAYVNRSYEECETDIDKDMMGIMLKGKITSAIAANELYTRDWNLEPVPVITRQFHAEPQEEGPVTFKSRLSDRLGNMSRNYRGGPRNRNRSRSRSRSRSPSRKRSSRSSFMEDRRSSFTNKKNNTQPLSKKAKKRAKAALTANHNGSVLGSVVESSNERLQARAARFDPPATRSTPVSIHSRITYEMDTEGDFSEEISDCHIVGTCTDLTKPFLRLTSAPDPSQVRPVPVLKQSLALAVDKWAEFHDYHNTCEQLKSIRQDLTVQGVRDEFAMEVYETHARICLEKGDPQEFNQCQTQLKSLYTELNATERKNEFTAYRILYFLYTKNSQDLTSIIGSITPGEKNDECISHALQVAHAWYTANYHRLFALYREAPKMAGQLMGWFIERERKAALKTIIKAYRQTIPTVILADKLAFEAIDEFLTFAQPLALTYSGEGGTLVDCKQSMQALSNI